MDIRVRKYDEAKHESLKQAAALPAGSEISGLSNRWMHAAETVDFAFQPIVNPLTGITFAVEALVRKTTEAGFRSISEMFDGAYEEKALYAFDIELRRKAIRKFSLIGFTHRIKIFYNYDPRVHEMPDYTYGITEKILRDLSFENNIITFELSERHRVKSSESFRAFLERSKKRGFKIALDDFGAGFAGFELFYHSEPDFLKFDRFLISGIDSDMKKRTFCTHIISLAKLLGVIVVAEGVETEKEFLTCKDLGFDLVQGYYIQRPATATGDLRHVYEHIREHEKKNRRARNGNTHLVLKELSYLDTLSIGDDIRVLFKRFNRNSENSLFPVLDANGFPVGIIHERRIKKYIYAPYGYDLLCNKSLTGSLQAFVDKCPMADIHTPQNKILEIFANNPQSDGVIITEDLKYVGFLTARSLLSILHEITLAEAREMNPLTKLPGNILINRYILDALSRQENYYYFMYFDFDNFKPFNDRFGFRQGDRIIHLFAEIIKKEFQGSKSFVGHIGGDDFFTGIESQGGELEAQSARALAVIDRFNSATSGFYSADELSGGFYEARDRDGISKTLPLLTVSAAVIEVPAGERLYLQDEIVSMLTDMKAHAKRSPSRMSSASLSPGAPKP
jgi:EAL domain-containing protein (putative c-di-GMP-specific phosphodiesterase class I)/GGDEF domain-containing protein